MLGIAMYNTIETLFKQGFNKSEISRMTGHDWKTISKVLKQIKQGNNIPSRKVVPSKLEPHHDLILSLLEQDLSAVRIYEELQKQGASASYSTLTNYLRPMKKRNDICVRFHTNPGEEAQVDFGYAGLSKDDNGKNRKTWVFNMRLSYSRLDYYTIVYNQTVETFIKCHVDAFQYFGGVPTTVKIDNLKAAILEANFYEPIYQQLYKSFAEHYGFHCVPCRVRKPQEKGKVESGIKYVKNNFFAGRQFNNRTDLLHQLNIWLNNTCNTRVHGTTKKRPIELFNDMEASTLKSLPKDNFDNPKVGHRKVYKDCHIYVEHNYYSVPYEYVGLDVEISMTKDILHVSYQNTNIAIHALADGTGQFVTNNEHYPPYKKPINNLRDNYRAKLSDIGEYAAEVFALLLIQQPYHWSRVVQGLLSLRKQYSNEVINLACKRAIAYNALHYRKIKEICKQGYYNLPIDN